MLERETVALILPVITAFVGFLGLVVGSFLNVVVWRLPRGESLLHPGSHCPKCGHAIRPWENVPVLSWLCLRGRCSRCGLPISVRYPLLEAATGILFLAVWWRLWQSAMPLSAVWGLLYLAAALLAASLIDIEHFLIPDRITFCGMGVAATLAMLFPESHLGAGLTGHAGSDQVVTGWALGVLRRQGPEWLILPRSAALLDVLLGVGMGFGMLWALREASRRLWGRLRVTPETPVRAVFSAEGIRTEDGTLDAAWEDLLWQRGDRFRAWTAPNDNPETAPENPITVTRNTIALDGRPRPRNELETTERTLTAWEFPREVMGQGDLKLLAMVGAFLGPDACVFVLMLGSFAGCGWGIGRLLAGRTRAPLPFGPFLAAATLFWILAARAFVSWYAGALFG
ncbi:MAG: prepilin peptidase [Lentisphaeria bacterium]|nr:prepilin peptidase [Lentisphaeria bacterium]